MTSQGDVSDTQIAYLDINLVLIKRGDSTLYRHELNLTLVYLNVSKAVEHYLTPRKINGSQRVDAEHAYYVYNG